MRVSSPDGSGDREAKVVSTPHVEPPNTYRKRRRPGMLAQGVPASRAQKDVSDSHVNCIGFAPTPMLVPEMPARPV